MTRIASKLWLSFLTACFAIANIRSQTVTWKADHAPGWVDNSSWQLAANFVEGVAPVAGDTVVIPPEKTVTVDDASISFVKTLGRVSAADVSSAVVFTLNGAVPVTNDCCLGVVTTTAKTNATDVGRYVKRGSGEMVLGAVGAFDNYARFIVEEGSLRLPPGVDPVSPDANRNYHELSVSNGATLYMCYGNPENTTGGNFTRTRYLYLAGTLSNPCPGRNLRVFGADRVSVVYPEAEFVNAVELRTEGLVDIRKSNLTGSHKFGVYFGGSLGVTALGGTSAASSIGSGSGFNFCEAKDGVIGTLRFLGENSGSGKNVAVAASGGVKGHAIIDAGPVGGLSLWSTGVWQADTGNSVASFVFTGSNTVPSSIGTAFATSGNRHYSLTKRGSGRWNIARVYTNEFGNVTVEEGVLGVKTLYDRGEPCSLGTGLVNFPASFYGTSTNLADRVDYSLVLGSAADRPAVFEYYGDKSVLSAGRLTAVAGDATLRNATAHAFRIQGFRSIAAKAATLTLDGTYDMTNALANVSDTGAGALSIVKKGAGIWTLSGTNAIRGAVIAKEGTFVVQGNDVPYDWFRFVGKKNYGNYAAASEIGRFAILNSSGQNLATTLYNGYSKRVYERADLAPGACCLWGQTGYSSSGTYSTLECMFYYYSTSRDYRAAIIHTVNGVSTAPDPEKPETWIEFALRVKAGSGAAASYDFTTGRNDEKNEHFTTWDLYGSNDGLNWDLLDSKTDYPFKQADITWYATSNTYENALHKGWPIAGRPTAPVQTVGAVGAEDGALLEAKGTVIANGIRVDAQATGGTVKGFTFAEAGAVEVLNLGSSMEIELPLTIVDAKDLSNVANWQVRVDGRLRKGFRASVDEQMGKVSIASDGMLLLIR